MAQKPIGLRMDPDLIERVDAARGELPRAVFITRAVEAALGDGSAVAASGASSGSNRLAPPRASAPDVERAVEAHRALPKPRRADYVTGAAWQAAVRSWRGQA